MIDRRLIGDVALAVLLAMPTLALARPQQAMPERTAQAAAPMVEQAALADQSSTERRFSLEG